MPSKPWSNVSVVVTRPEPTASKLCKKLTELGANTYAYPTLSIEALELTEPQLGWLSAPEQFAKIIWISRHAVAATAPRLVFAKLKPEAELLTVGEGTRGSLGEYTDFAVLAPPQADSEGLLALKELQQVEGQRILLIKGEGGRPLLEQTLRERGADLCILPCYQRRPTMISPAGLLAWWQQICHPGQASFAGAEPGSPRQQRRSRIVSCGNFRDDTHDTKAWIIITSGTSLQQFYQQLTTHADAILKPALAQPLLAECHYLMASQRLVDLALSLGIVAKHDMLQRCVVAKGACDQHQIDAIIEFYS